MTINGDRLKNMRFTDYVVTISDNLKDTDMFKELTIESNTVGLKVNISKTTIISNVKEEIRIELDENYLEFLNMYIIQIFIISKENQTAEMNRRVRLGRAAFGKLSQIVKN